MVFGDVFRTLVRFHETVHLSTIIFFHFGPGFHMHSNESVIAGLGIDPLLTPCK
jgi:hypothetical protein